ncbi:MAG: DUF4199 domain-containing protein [Cytophagales bacterium]|nr:MAG: DUF4199 domain-containing protein [Cytophagales bacterium]TAF60693.1 MAG: DUF4199 domain-containing protein [Cytophagales bacterium]
MKSLYRNALVLSLVYACWVVTKGFIGLDLMFNKWAGWGVVLLLVVLTYVFALQERKEQPSGYMTYTKAFSVCFFLIMIPYFSGILLEYFYFNTFLPDVVESFHQKMESILLEELDKSASQGSELSEEQHEIAVKTGMGMSPYKPWGVVFLLLGAGFTSAAVSALMALFVRKKDPNQEF